MSTTPKIYNLSTLLRSPHHPWTRIVKDPIKRQLKNELKLVSLKSVKRVDVRFDPFHHNISSIRQFLTAVSSTKTRATNPKCGLKTEILSKRQEPTITVSLESGQRIVFKTSLLSTLEIAENYNKILNRLTQSVP